MATFTVILNLQNSTFQIAIQCILGYGFSMEFRCCWGERGWRWCCCRKRAVGGGGGLHDFRMILQKKTENLDFTIKNKIYIFLEARSIIHTVLFTDFEPKHSNKAILFYCFVIVTNEFFLRATFFLCCLESVRSVFCFVLRQRHATRAIC